ncbi:hypothetical protein ACRQ5D_31015 [Mucilaginibacter sp. P25]|uniref:hypothetical protein n=1 Tax=Mucilaginibacter TaxID=423349 RepID=UPI00210EFBAA|nr:hypothetical protein [Mucilaginibacter gossypii]
MLKSLLNTRISYYKYYNRSILKATPLLHLLVTLTTISVSAQNLSVKTALASKSTDITVATAQKSISLAIDNSDYQAVKLAACFFADDIKQVAGTSPAITTLQRPSAEMIIAGTIGKSPAIDRLIAAHKIKDIIKIKGRWEASLWQIVNNPAPGVKKALIIVGSDRRGTVYGLLQISRKIGVCHGIGGQMFLLLKEKQLRSPYLNQLGMNRQLNIAVSLLMMKTGE